MARELSSRRATGLGGLIRSLSMLAVMAGCASAGGGEDPFSGAARRSARASGPIEIAVANNGFLDIHLYVIQAGQSRSLGMVTGLSRVTLELPRSLAESLREVQLLVDPIGATRTFVTQPLLAYPGETIRLTVQNNLSLSTAWIEVARAEEPEEPEDPEDPPNP